MKLLKKTALLLTLSLLGAFPAYAQDVNVPDVLKDKDNGPYVWVSAESGIENINGKNVLRDLSGNDNHMTVYGSPEVIQRAVNQRPAISLTNDANQQYLSVQFPEAYTGPATLFIVANMKKYADYKGLFSTNTPDKKKVLNTFEAYFLNNQIESGSMNANGSDINKDYLFNRSDGDVFGKYHNFILTESGNITDGEWKSTNLKTYYGVYNKNTDKTTLTRMVNSKNKNNGLKVGMYNTFVGLSLGSRWDFNGNTPESEYAEAIMFKRELSESEILEVSNYLSEKYFKPFPPTDGIEYDMKVDEVESGDVKTATVSLSQIEGSVFGGNYYVVAQLYEDAKMTQPFDIMIKQKNEELTFSYDKTKYAKFMLFNIFGNDEDVGINIAHPVD